MIAYLTDVEGRWDKLASFLDGNPHVGLEDGALRLADGVTFVFGGDAIDRGPAGRRILALLVAARRRYGDRVVWLAGNRDLNKLRLVSELSGAPPRGAPDGASRGELLRWILARTMGAAGAFEHRAAELATDDDDAVVDSFLEDVAPGGLLRAYLEEARLGFRAGATLFLHGGLPAESFAGVSDVDAWLGSLDDFLRDQLDVFARGGVPAELIAYQAPLPGTHLNQESVVYARPTDEVGNPALPPADVVARLRAHGIARVVVGHTPTGDCPSIVRDGDFELVVADTSYSRLERGAQLAFTDDALHLRTTARLDDGTLAAIDFASARAEPSPIGLRDRATGRLVKAPLVGGGYHVFRGLPEHRVEQLAAPSADVEACALEPAR